MELQAPLQATTSGIVRVEPEQVRCQRAVRHKRMIHHRYNAWQRRRCRGGLASMKALVIARGLGQCLRGRRTARSALAAGGDARGSGGRPRRTRCAPVAVGISGLAPGVEFCGEPVGSLLNESRLGLQLRDACPCCRSAPSYRRRCGGRTLGGVRRTSRCAGSSPPAAVARRPRRSAWLAEGSPRFPITGSPPAAPAGGRVGRRPIPQGRAAPFRRSVQSDRLRRRGAGATQ
jgi:hypothetical protein